MEERYPYIRFIIGAAPAVAGAIAVILFLGGTLSACERGGFGGFVSFVVTLIVAGIGYIGTMVCVEALQAFIGIEEHTSEIAAGK